MLVELSWNKTSGFGTAVKKVMDLWDSLEESKENDQRSGKHGLPDRKEKQKEEFTLCCPLEERNSLKLQQRRVRLGVKDNILKAGHGNLEDSSIPVSGSFPEHARHTSLRSNTALPDSALGQRREFGGFFDVLMTH